jgi:hypothetical protein
MSLYVLGSGLVVQPEGASGLYTLGSGSIVQTVAGSTPIAFSGTIATQNATIGVPFSFDMASYFSGSLTPFTYSQIAGTLPAGLSLAGSVISGTPSGSPGTSSGLQFEGEDTGTNTDQTNAFDIVVAAASSDTPAARSTNLNAFGMGRFGNWR